MNLFQPLKLRLNNMFKNGREVSEILTGFILLFTAFIASLLMVIGVIEKDIVLSLFIYSMSLAGIVFGLHGILGWYQDRESNKQ